MYNKYFIKIAKFFNTALGCPNVPKAKSRATKSLFCRTGYLNWGAHQIRNEVWSWRPFRNMYLHVDRN